MFIITEKKEFIEIKAQELARCAPVICANCNEFATQIERMCIGNQYYGDFELYMEIAKKAISLIKKDQRKTRAERRDDTSFLFADCAKNLKKVLKNRCLGN